MRVKSPPFHDSIYRDYLDTSLRRVAYEAPRGHAKTTLFGKAIPLHYIFYGGDNRVLLIISRTTKHAVKVSTSIKNNLNRNVKLREIYGDWGQNTAQKWTEDETVLKNGTAIIPIGQGMQVRGVFSDDYRPTFVLIDDIEDKENTRSRDIMEFNFDWFLSEVLQSMDPQIGRVFVIGTMICHDCTLDRIRRLKGWTYRKFQAVTNWEKREVLWPEWWPYERLMEEKEMMESEGKGSLWWREFQGELRTGGDSLCNISDIKRIKDYSIRLLPDKDFKLLGVTHEDGHIETNIPVFTFGGVDPAVSVESSADYSVIFLQARAQNRTFDLDMFRNKVPPMGLAAEIVRWNNRFQFNGINIETNGYQQMLRDKLIEDGCYIPGMERQNTARTSKNERLRGLYTPLMFPGHYINNTTLGPYLDEIDRFPYGRHDDTLDGKWYAHKHSYPCLEEYREQKGDSKLSEKRLGTNWVTGRPISVPQ